MVKATTAGGAGAGKWARRAARWFVAGCVMAGGAGAAWAGNAPPVSTMLRYHPAQDGVAVSTPKPEEEAGCKVELVKGPNGQGSGWALKDANGKTLRLFFSHNDKNLDTWSYYKDGVEVYREFESEGGAGKPDQFRWVNADGMKWGVDDSKTGHIKFWKVISAEEVSQEVLQALATKDFARLQTLMISEAEMKQLGLPEDQIAHVRELQKGAAAKFQKAVADLPKLTAGKPTWVHLETSAPECAPAEQTGAHADIVKYSHGSILFEVAGATDWVQTGEMIQVGSAWRLTDAPAAGATPVESAGIDKGLDGDPKLMELINELTDLDKKTPEATNGPNPLMARHHLARVEILEKIIAAAKPEARDPWIRQMADSLSTAAQNSPSGDTAAMTQLVRLEEGMAKSVPGSNLAAYVTYREMQADYAVRIQQSTSGGKDAKGAPDFNALQQAWVDRLTKFVEAYPKAEDTPDALLQLGMVNEFLNKDVEAKNWYGVLVKNFPDTPQGHKAGGAIRRLGLEGQPIKLAGPKLDEPNVVYDVDQAQGKVVVVYYWASWNSQTASDFNKLKALMDTQGTKGVELVCVNLDNTAKEAQDFLSRSPAPGVHLFQSGGLESKLATDYGIFVLPNLFLVGRDGKVVSRNVQINNLDDEVKKQLTK